MTTIKLLPVTQPIGTFYIGKMFTKTLLKISFVRRRNEINEGIQRNLDIGRANKISEYLEDPDATFPTPIILSVDSSTVDFEQNDDFCTLTFDENSNTQTAEIIDGQHRVEALKSKPDNIEELPVVVLFDLSQEEKAYIFSVINSNQKPVPKSYIYDLFELNTGRSPVKTCHTIIKLLNSDPSSPFYKRIKMLGKKNSQNETISQGSFVDSILKLITNNKDRDELDLKNNRSLEKNDRCVLRDLFIEEKDEIIYKILLNYFNAVKAVFPDEWSDTHKYVLTKTAGIGGLCKAFEYAYKMGIENSDLSQGFFRDLFFKSKNDFNVRNISIISKKYGSGESAQKLLKDDLIKSWQIG